MVTISFQLAVKCQVLCVKLHVLDVFRLVASDQDIVC